MKLFRAIAVRASAALITFTIAMSLTVVWRLYVYRRPAFANAAMMGHFTLMKLLYALGDIDVNGSEGLCYNCFTPLWGAAYGGYDGEVRFLLDRGADVNGKTGFDQTPLMIAASQGHESTVRLLLSRGADVFAEWQGDDTALTLARRRRHSGVVELLQQAGARETR
jgi:ankyrin repeat protein